MSAEVLFPDATLLVIEYLRDRLPAYGITATVHHTVPSPRPAQLIRVLRTGGPRRDAVSDTPQLTVECWAQREDQAHTIAQVARALLGGMSGRTLDGVAAYRVSELGGPAPLPDPLSDQPRYVFSVQVALRGSALA